MIYNNGQRRPTKRLPRHPSRKRPLANLTNTAASARTSPVHQKRTPQKQREISTQLASGVPTNGTPITGPFPTTGRTSELPPIKTPTNPTNPLAQQLKFQKDQTEAAHIATEAADATTKAADAATEAAASVVKEAAAALAETAITAITAITAEPEETEETEETEVVSDLEGDETDVESYSEGDETEPHPFIVLAANKLASKFHSQQTLKKLAYLSFGTEVIAALTVNPFFSLCAGSTVPMIARYQVLGDLKKMIIDLQLNAQEAILKHASNRTSKDTDLFPKPNLPDKLFKKLTSINTFTKKVDIEMKKFLTPKEALDFLCLLRLFNMSDPTFSRHLLSGNSVSSDSVFVVGWGPGALTKKRGGNLLTIGGNNTFNSPDRPGSGSNTVTFHGPTNTPTAGSDPDLRSPNDLAVFSPKVNRLVTVTRRSKVSPEKPSPSATNKLPVNPTAPFS
ncbi:hypothetical protein OAJ27_00375 [bacterium]|nr:hypothetical protein [bacterium]